MPEADRGIDGPFNFRRREQVSAVQQFAPGCVVDRFADAVRVQPDRAVVVHRVRDVCGRDDRRSTGVPSARRFPPPLAPTG